MILVDQFGEVEDGECAVILYSGKIERPGGLNLIVEVAKMLALLIGCNKCHPFGSILINPLETASIIGKFPSVHHILSMRGRAEIRPAIIQTIAVSVVNFSNSGKKLLHSNHAYTTVLHALSFCIKSTIMFIPNGIPCPLGQKVIIAGIDDRNLTLRERYKPLGGIFWLYNRMARFGTTAFAYFSLVPFKTFAVRTSVVVSKRSQRNLSGIWGRLDLRFGHLFKQGAHRLPPLSAGWAALEAF